MVHTHRGVGRRRAHNRGTAGTPRRVGGLQRLASAMGNRAFTDLVRRAEPARPGVAVQRLVTGEYMQRFAGAPSSHAIDNDSTYVKMLRGLDGYAEWAKEHPESTSSLRRAQLKPLKGLIDKWLADHKKPSTRRKFIEGLLSDVQQEMFGKASGAASDHGMSPTQGMLDQLEALEGALTPDLDVEGPAADSYTFTVVAAVGHTDYLAFARERFSLRNNPLRRKGTKSTAAKNVLMEKFRAQHKRKMSKAEQSDKAFLAEAAKLADAGVGHTYVKLTAKSGDRVLRVFSFGFYPLVDPERPSDIRPGLVVHPDRAHEDKSDETRRFKDFPITEESYGAGLTKAQELLVDPPAYQMWDYNCTRFAKVVGEAAGVSVPGGFKTVPAAGRLLKAYSPNQTYDALSADEDSYEESKDLAAYREANAPAPKPNEVFDDPVPVYESASEEEQQTTVMMRSDFQIVSVEGAWVGVRGTGNSDLVEGYMRRADLERNRIPIEPDI